jgi:hypothetical protein
LDKEGSISPTFFLFLFTSALAELPAHIIEVTIPVSWANIILISNVKGPIRRKTVLVKIM